MLLKHPADRPAALGTVDHRAVLPTECCSGAAEQWEHFRPLRLLSYLADNSVLENLRYGRHNVLLFSALGDATDLPLQLAVHVHVTHVHIDQSCLSQHFQALLERLHVPEIPECRLNCNGIHPPVHSLWRPVFLHVIEQKHRYWHILQAGQRKKQPFRLDADARDLVADRVDLQLQFLVQLEIASLYGDQLSRLQRFGFVLQF